MRVCFTPLVLILSLAGTALATGAAGQEVLKKKISVSIREESFKQVLHLIRKKTDVKFIYVASRIPDNATISLTATDEELGSVFQRLFQPLNIAYDVVDKQVVLKAMPPTATGTATDRADENREVAVRPIKGRVTNEKGEPLSGVTVQAKGADLYTLTDANGNFKMNVEDNITGLIFSYVGMETQEVSIAEKQTVEVTLKSAEKSMEDLVVTAFGNKQKRQNVVGAVTSVNVKDLKVPSSNLTTALAGRIPGIISYQRSGEPGQDNAAFFIRGVTTFGYKQDPLILVDNVEVTPTDLARLQPDDISSFSILKDASATALYGARGANGVILISTKEGKEGKANVSIRVENSVASNTRNIEFVDPITYMKLHNEATLTRNPLGLLPYDQTKIDHTSDPNRNPFVYPAVNWLDMLIKPTTTNQRANFNVSGGGKTARYYIAATLNQDNGNLKVDKRNNFNTNVNLKNYQLRSNININVTPTTEVVVRLYGNFDEYRGPMDGGAGVYAKAIRANPVLYPAYFKPDSATSRLGHILFGNYDKDGRYLNPYADLVKGYKEFSRSRMSAQFELNQKLGFITRGLNFRGLASTNRYSFFEVSRFYKPYFYQVGSYDKQANKYLLGVLNPDVATEYIDYKEGAKEIETFLYLQGALDYNRTFGGVHTVSSSLITTLQQNLRANAGSLQLSLPFRNSGLSGRLSYSYDNRYFTEFNFGYNGSERFYKTNQFGFFPTIGAGWMVSNEKFWAPFEKVVSKLKLRGSYGLIGNDAIGSPTDRFFFLSQVNMTDPSRGASFGTNGANTKPGISVSRYENTDITWEKSYQTNLAMELQLFKKINLIAEVYRQKRTNILMDRVSIPTTMGLSAPSRANVGQASSKGIDLSLDFNHNVNKNFSIAGRANLTYATSKFEVFEEPYYKDRYLSRVGRSLSQVWGFVAERLFVDDKEVSNAPRQNYGEYRGGDIKYRDINGDGQITDLDRVPIGYPTTPEITYGFGTSLGYKGLDFSLFFQGLARESFWIDPVATAPFVDVDGDPATLSNNAMLKSYASSFWSEENKDLYALWPRLSPNVVNNNIQTSTWFMRDGSFLRLKSVELGYTFNSKFLRTKVHMASARLYLNGTNLLTFSRFRLWDPEMGGNGLGYPIQKVINVGAVLNF